MNIYRNIFLAGGTGSWGHELIYQLLNLSSELFIKKIIVYSRGELAQVETERKFKKLAEEKNVELKFIIGDIRDYDALLEATKEVDLIFLLSALKHVPVCEKQAEEAIKTNINGTLNIIKSAIQNKVSKIVDVSTDKACEPVNFYGLTKAIGEHLILNNNCLTEFVCVRGGNAMGSNGSVIPLFIKQIKENNYVTITDPNMTRFFISLHDAIQLLLTAVYEDLNNCILVIKMKSIKMETLAKLLIQEYGDSNTEIKKIPIRKGEKMHEVLVSKYEAEKTKDFNHRYFLIDVNELYDNKFKDANITEYSSKENILTIPDSYKLLLSSNFIRKKRIAILGSTGLIGHVLYQYLKERDCYELYPINRDNFNLREPQNITNLCHYLKELNPDFIVNCIGTLIEQSNNDFEIAKITNIFLPNSLESYFYESKTRIIHLSTNCVFDGIDNYPYDENSLPNEKSNYGLSKISGEINNEKDLTIRTSIIGPEIRKNKTGLFDWFMNQKEKCSGYTNHIWNGLCVTTLVKLIELLFFENISGILHLYSQESISKFDLLYKINKIFNKNIEIKPLSKEDYIINKCLKSIYNKKYLDIFNVIPFYDKQLGEMKSWISEHKEMYSK